MASLAQWDTRWQNQFKKTYATDLSLLALSPTDALGWVTIKDVPYGQKQVEIPVRHPDQRVHVSKNEEFPQPKYAAREVIALDMPSITDELRVKEEYYAGDTANALGHVSDLTRNYKRAISKVMWEGTDTDPYSFGMVENETSASTTFQKPGHVDTASALTTAGAWDVYEQMSKDIAQMVAALEAKGHNGPKGLLAAPLMRPFLSRYKIEYTAQDYSFGMPVFYNPYIDTGATTGAAAVYCVDLSSFAFHMTPMKARAFWSDESESYAWRWKIRSVCFGRSFWDGTDYTKGIVGFDVDLIT